MSITRSPRPESGFYILDKRISEDRQLSWEARGMLVYLLGKPDHWVVSLQALINETKDTRKHSGRDAVRGIIRELIDVGYIRRSLKRGGDAGKLSGYDYMVSEIPTLKLPETDYPATAKPATEEPGPDYPATEKPAPANPQLVSNETSSKKEVKQELNTSAADAANDEYSRDFEDAWAIYPKRAGSNPKRGAYKAWAARLKAGEQAQEMLDGVMRYAAFIQASGKAGTEFVQQAATFFGPNRHYLEAWEIAGVVNNRNARANPHQLPTGGYGQSSQLPADFNPDSEEVKRAAPY